MNNDTTQNPEVTKENYTECGAEYKTKITLCIIGILLSMIFPYLSIKSLMNNHYPDSGDIAPVVFFVFVMLIIWIYIFFKLKDAIKGLASVKKEYYKLLDQKERRKRKAKIILALTCIVSIFAAGIIERIIMNQRLDNTYRQAQALFENENYTEAVDIFHSIEDKGYKDTKSYIYYCEAQDEYEKGNLYEAVWRVNSLKFENISSEQKEIINGFKDRILTEYKKAKETEKNRAYDTKGLPYVGMNENYIYSTSLGSPVPQVAHSNRMIQGKNYTTNVYKFKEKGKTIFTVECVQGKVVYIIDTRDQNERQKYPVKTPEPKTKPKTNTTHNYTDPYNVNEYSNEEDFYDDNREDFYDFYEAEEYYNEHHK